MNPLKRLAFTAYYYGMKSKRTAHARRLAEQGNAPVSVLFYHRVADNHPNDWTMSRDGFRRQMNWLRDHAELVDVEGVQDRVSHGNHKELVASVTFDDGYADNCDFAIPFLVEAKIPVTYFVALSFVKGNLTFPHDKKHGQHLAPNTIDQLKEMVQAGVEIGAHTDTHCDLGKITDPDRIRDEIVSATLELGDLVGQPIRYFAFPYGQADNLSASAARMAATEAGIKGVCSAFGAYNLPGNDPFHIRRFHGDPEFTRWRNWVSIDPRKLQEGQRIGCELEFESTEPNQIAEPVQIGSGAAQ